MKTQTTLTCVLVTVLAGFAFSAGASAENLLLWNRFESEQEVVTGTEYGGTQWGPGFQLTNYIYDSWEEAQIVPAMFGNGLYVNHDTNEGWNGDGANFFAADLWDIGLTPSQGTIEFWFKFKYDCSFHNHAHFFNSLNELTGHLPGPPSDENTTISATWVGWSGPDRKYYTFGIGNADWLPPHPRASTPFGSAGPGGHLAFETDSVHHFGFVWDVDGIDGSADTMRLYVNGVVEGATTDAWDTTDPFRQYLYLGTTPNYGSWDHYYNAVKGVTDNLKMWDYAVTDGFAHRFDENWVPEPGTLGLLGLGGLALLRRRR